MVEEGRVLEIIANFYLHNRTVSLQDIIMNCFTNFLEARLKVFTFFKNFRHLLLFSKFQLNVL